MVDAEDFLRNYFSSSPTSGLAHDGVSFVVDEENDSSTDVQPFSLLHSVLSNNLAHEYGSEEFSTAHSFKKNKHVRGGHVTSRKPHAVNPTNFNECKESALKMLDRRNYSSSLLVEKLKDKGYVEEIAQAVVNKLIELLLIDDCAYAEAVMNSGLERLLGIYGIRQEMQRKGVSEEYIELWCKKSQENDAFFQSAQKLADRYFRGVNAKNYETIKRRYWSAGARKGHEIDLLKMAADKYIRSSYAHDDIDNISEDREKLEEK